MTGPVSRGLNTRFGQYSGGGVNSTDYPPDVITREPNPLLTYNSNTNEIRQGSTVVTQANQINYNLHVLGAGAGQATTTTRPPRTASAHLTDGC